MWTSAEAIAPTPTLPWLTKSLPVPIDGIMSEGALYHNTDLWHRLYFARQESGHGFHLMVQWWHGSTDLAERHSAQVESLPRLLAMLHGTAKAPVWGCLWVSDTCQVKCALRRGLMPAGNLAGCQMPWAFKEEILSLASHSPLLLAAWDQGIPSTRCSTQVLHCACAELRGTTLPAPCV